MFAVSVALYTLCMVQLKQSFVVLTYCVKLSSCLQLYLVFYYSYLTVLILGVDMHRNKVNFTFVLKTDTIVCSYCAFL